MQLLCHFVQQSLEISSVNGENEIPLDGKLSWVQSRNCELNGREDLGSVLGASKFGFQFFQNFLARLLDVHFQIS